MSSVYDGFLTSLVIEYVLLFACSSLRLFPNSPLVVLPHSSPTFFLAALPQTTLMYFQFCGFSCLLLRLSRGNFCAGVAANSPKVLVRTPPRIEVFTFSFSSLVFWSFLFLPLDGFDSTHRIYIDLAFVLSDMPETS